MSICSYCNFDCWYPIDTETNDSKWLLPEEQDGRMHVEADCEGLYSDSFLDDLVDLFGKPLDEVPGLELEAFYQCYDDDGWQCILTIKDGKVTCQETVLVWQECTLDSTPINIGHKKN